MDKKIQEIRTALEAADIHAPGRWIDPEKGRLLNYIEFLLQLTDEKDKAIEEERTETQRMFRMLKTESGLARSAHKRIESLEKKIESLLKGEDTP